MKSASLYDVRSPLIGALLIKRFYLSSLWFRLAGGWAYARSADIKQEVMWFRSVTNNKDGCVKEEQRRSFPVFSLLGFLFMLLFFPRSGNIWAAGEKPLEHGSVCTKNGSGKLLQVSGVRFQAGLISKEWLVFALISVLRWELQLLSVVLWWCSLLKGNEFSQMKEVPRQTRGILYNILHNISVYY